MHCIVARTYVRNCDVSGSSVTPQRQNAPHPLPLPRLLQHLPVSAIEIPFDLGLAPRERVDVAAVLAARALDLAVDARELEL
jgi:hypothetical protein